MLVKLQLALCHRGSATLSKTRTDRMKRLRTILSSSRSLRSRLRIRRLTSSQLCKVASSRTIEWIRLNTVDTCLRMAFAPVTNHLTCWQIRTTLVAEKSSRLTRANTATTQCPTPNLSMSSKRTGKDSSKSSAPKQFVATQLKPITILSEMLRISHRDSTCCRVAKKLKHSLSKATRMRPKI